MRHPKQPIEMVLKRRKKVIIPDKKKVSNKNLCRKKIKGATN